MSAFSANLLNAVLLLMMGTWGVLDGYNTDGNNMSPTSFIPVIFGVLFLILSPWVKRHNKTVTHLIVILTLVLLIALFKPFMAREGLAKIRVLIEMIGCLIAIIFFIKSFIDARRNRIANS